MTNETKKPSDDGSTLRILAKNEEDARRVVAATVTKASVNAAAILKEYNRKFERLDINELVEELSRHCEAVNDGDLKQAEAMLIAQANALQTIFTNLCLRASLNMGEHLNATEIYLRLALKAQSQCRATLHTLGELKYPRETAFIRQQNVALNQQVNNGTQDLAREKKQNLTNELLENQHERVDIGAPVTAGGADPALETVGAVERTEIRKGQSRLPDEREETRAAVSGMERTQARPQATGADASNNRSMMWFV